MDDMAEQDEIDSLMDSINNPEDDASAAAASNNPEDGDSFITSKNLTKESESQKTADNSSKKDPRGIPWIDFFPEFIHKRPDDLVLRMLEEQDNIRQILLIKELYRLRTLEIKIHRSYYWLWVREANAIIRNAVRLRARIKKLKEQKNSKKPS